MIAAFPLQWPERWPRTDNFRKKHGKFFKSDFAAQRKRDLTVFDGVERELTELERMGIDRQDVVISTNVRTRLDGLPRSGERELDDGGAAVYWETRKGERRVMAIDAYLKVADNLAAIAATLDAMRAIERHGGAQILERAFTGFTALPAPAAKRSWREVMIFGESTPTADQLRQRYRELANSRHPDKGGSDAAMAELNVAYGEAKQELSL